MCFEIAVNYFDHADKFDFAESKNITYSVNRYSYESVFSVPFYVKRLKVQLVDHC